MIRVVYSYFNSSLQLPRLQNKRHKCIHDILKEFWIIVTRADALVHDRFGSEQSWLQAAVFQGNHGRVFEELNLDLKACVRLFHDSTGHPIPVIDSATIWRYELLYFELDAKSLRVILEDLLARPELGEQERLLAQYLLEREKSTYSQDGSVRQFFFVKRKYPDSILSHIGHGSFGTVYAVKWLGINCAKKHFSSPKDEKSVQEILREVCVLATLNHPHIVKLLCASDDSEVSFVMELMPMSLPAFIEERWKASPVGMAPSAAIDIMLHIALGLSA